MNKLFVAGFAAVLTLSMAIPVDAATVQTITVNKQVVKVTHEQCVMMRMGRAKTDSARMNAEKWCAKRGDTVPRKW